MFKLQSDEHRVMLQNITKSYFTNFISCYKSLMKDCKKSSDFNTLEIINLLKNRIILIYRVALKYFNYDLSLWTKYMKFLVKIKHPTLLQKVINSALLLHGNISDRLYIYAVEIEIGFLRNIQKAREIYTSGLRSHKYSSNLYFEAFKCELTNSKMMIQEVLKSGKELDSYDPALDVSVAKVIFELAVQNMKEDYDLFFEMYHAAIEYHFSLDLSKEIKKFMSTTFNKNPNYWDTLALNELYKTTYNYKNMNII
eukprot:XP_003241351.2 PREDICTED: U3 small nucleolar RNA-associated protein 6 homolog isoform X2 [Acyrthosiphon pisum]